MYWLSKFILWIIGWKIVGDYPYEVKKKLLIAAPHTSNWDFPLGVIVRSAIKADVKYIGKAPLFKPPLGWIMKPLGGIPVHTDKSTNFVQAVVNEYNNRSELSILIAPEGQRLKTEKFKTGFYYIAKLADIPILPVVLDFGKKEFRFLELVHLTDNVEKDISAIQDLYRGIKGLYAKDSFDYPLED